MLIANYASSLSASASVTEILSGFVSSMLNRQQSTLGKSDEVITRDGLWHVQNPVYPENLIHEWTDEDARAMFGWLKSLGAYLGIDASDHAMLTSSLRNLFGNKSAAKISSVVMTAPSVVKSSEIKPWRW